MKTTDRVGDLIAHPAFKEFGQFMLPLERYYDEIMPLSDAGSLMPYHNGVDPEAVVETFNYND